MRTEQKKDAEVTAKFKTANDKIRMRLKKVANIAEAALQSQPHDEVPCFEHLSIAEGRIETEMLIKTGLEPELSEWHPLEIPECDIDFQRFYSQDCEVYICAWKNENIAHVYEVRCSRFEGQWRATLSNDGRTVGELLAPGRHACYMLALGAMRAYLRRGHRKTIKAKKAAAALAGARSDAAEPTND